jgi:hypothetical protein
MKLAYTEMILLLHSLQVLIQILKVKMLKQEIWAVEEIHLRFYREKQFQPQKYQQITTIIQAIRVLY